MKNNPEKVAWAGVIISVQPRTSVWRYKIDNRTHYYNGYNLFLEGEVEAAAKRFSVAISEKQQMKNEFRIGDFVKGTAWTKMYSYSEYADFYRAGNLKVINRPDGYIPITVPPYIMPLPDMETYAQRGARMLSPACYKGKCFQCIWAAMASVVIEYDWGVRQKYRFESFCYGPKSCKFYKMGKPRAVPYKDEGSFYDDGCLDEIITYGRGLDE